MMLLRFSQQKGFTLVELIIVTGLILFLSVVALQSFSSSINQMTFQNNSEKVLSLIRQARSLAITGKAQLDYTDFDKDTFTDATPAPNGPDYVTPAHYGIHFSHSNNLTIPDSITLFIDNHSNGNPNFQEGRFDQSTSQKPVQILIDRQQGADIVLEQYILPPTIRLINLPGNEVTLFYSSIFADISFDQVTALSNDPSIQKGILKFGLEQGNNKKDQRHRCFQTHRISGIPELTSCQ